VILALLADLHANLEATEACLAEARALGAERFAFLGDLVGYGADPGAVVDLVADLAARGAVVVRGNHDEAVLALRPDQLNREAERAVLWTREHLGPGQLRFLASLPLTLREGPALYVHASAARPADFDYVTDARRAAESLASTDATWVFTGHVHEQALYVTGPDGWPVAFRPTPGVAIPTPPHRRWHAVVGSAGQPRDGSTAACYALADLERRTLTFRRVPYDWTAAAAKIRAAGLPEFLAARLGLGT
jgi:diadenosine tetraphosphatase ApaH/serine/threonine PP2A family protein phosphatase